MFPKALACGVDMVCVELEDGIAPHDKAEARKHALNLFKDDKGFENVERILRINSCLLYTSPSPRDFEASRMPSSA